MRRLEQREDFAQFFCLAVLQGEISSLKYQFANFMREEGGRPRGGKLHPKYFLNLAYKPLTENYDYSSLKAPPVDSFRQVVVSELKEALKHLKAQHLLVASLHLRGFNQLEIAAKMGLTPPRVSQIWGEIVLKLRKRMC